MRSIWNWANAGMKRIGGFIRKKYKSILYYAAMVLVLALVASAAEKYRTKDENPEETLLPEAVQETISEAEPKIIYPEGMHLLRDFCDRPMWNDALCQWETHFACDYVLDNDRVICLEDGCVIDVGESSLKGGYIEIEAEDGKTYRYASVRPAQDICVGDTVYAGEIIAEADDGMASELTLGKHLHLEIVEEENWEDFEQICGKNVTDAD